MRIHASPALTRTLSLQQGGASTSALPHGAAGILVSSDGSKDRTTCAQLSDYFTEARPSRGVCATQ